VIGMTGAFVLVMAVPGSPTAATAKALHDVVDSSCMMVVHHNAISIV
jgi:hypothetical protein